MKRAALGARIVRETSRFALIQMGVSGLSWGTHVMLARLLDRRDFGVFGVCLFYIGLSQLLGSGGLGAALLRRKAEVRDEEYRVVLTALLGIASLLAASLIVAAPWIAASNGFTDSEATALRVMAPLGLLNALRTVPGVRLERALAFGIIGRIDLAASAVRCGLALALAARWGTVWALLISHVAAALVQLALAYRAAPGFPGLGWSWSVFRPLLAYGSQVQSLALLAYMKDNVSRALLGSSLGPAAVGLYDFSMGFIQVPVVAVNGLARVQLPVYAQLERGDPTLIATVRGALRTATLVGMPLLGALAFGAPALIPLLYGEKWAPASVVIWALMPNMICGLWLSPLFTLLQGQGRAGLALLVFAGWTSVTWALAIVVLLAFPGALAAVGVAQSVATVLATGALSHWAAQHLGRGLGGFVIRPVLAAALGGVVGFAFQQSSNGATSALGAMAAFLTTYALALTLSEGKAIVRELRAVVAMARRPSAS